MTVNAEAKAAESYAERVADLTLADAAVRSARAKLRRAGQVEENKARQEALQARQEAEAAVAAKSVALDAKRRHLADLIARDEAGDETLTGAEIAAAKEDVPLAERRLARAEQEASQVRRVTAAAVSDNHLANLAADVIETVTTAPVIVRSNPANAPDVSPKVVVSQRADTEGYGTVDASGAVDVLVVGETGLDWRRVPQAFADAGCDAQVSETGIVFHRASWPLPRLTEPSSVAVDRFARHMVSMWVENVEQHERRARLTELGYNVSTINDLGALARVEGVSLAAEDGTATGTARIRLGVKYLGAGTQVTADDLVSDAGSLVSALSRECIGEVTPAGQITSVELVSAERSAGDVWDVAATYGATGNALWPATIMAEVRLGFAYEPAHGHEIAED
ncbi:MAG TPA: hypothetical protein VFT70_12095 [Nocardioides sp.]|nr:hypothetical protein [Nocardioides sp.]